MDRCTAPAREELINKVWIAPGCILCNVCTELCPEVFEFRGEGCAVRSPGQGADYYGKWSDALVIAAQRCPVKVIHFEAVEVDRPKDGLSDLSRRGFLSSAGLGWAALAGAAAAGALSLNRFMFPNAAGQSDQRITAGELARYRDMPAGSVVEDFRAAGFYLVRQRGGLAAVSTVCTHLGCIVNWHRDTGIFQCPCHGSRFRGDGLHLAGPAPRPLERFRIIARDGMVVVDRGRKFTRPSQWREQESYIAIEEPSSVS